MMTAQERFDAIMAKAYQEAYSTYVDGIREVLAACPELDYYLDAMGAQYFVDFAGEIVEDEDLPEPAQAFMVFAAEFYSYFKSVGFKVCRGQTITDW